MSSVNGITKTDDYGETRMDDYGGLEIPSYGGDVPYLYGELTVLRH